MREDPDRGVREGREHAIRLILAPPEPRMWRGQHDVERGRFIGSQIELARGVDVRLDSL